MATTEYFFKTSELVTILAAGASQDATTTKWEESFTRYFTNTYESRPTVTTIITITTVVDIVEIAPVACTRYIGDHIYTMQSNPDIAGIGVTVTFLVTACATLGLLLTAYIGGQLPDELLNRVDRKLFFARRGKKVWWNTIEGVALSLSDQQLITSLAIIIAGFREAFINDLDLYHWNTILYSGWLGITVHLPIFTAVGLIIEKAKPKVVSTPKPPILQLTDEHLDPTIEIQSIPKWFRDPRFRLLEAKEKLSLKTPDPMIEHIYSSRLFRAKCYIGILLLSMGLGFLLFWNSVEDRLAGDSSGSQSPMGFGFLALGIVSIAIFFTIIPDCSNRLKWD